MGWLLVLGQKECLVECATLCVKSEVMLDIMVALCFYLQLQWINQDQTAPQTHVNTLLIRSTATIKHIYSFAVHGQGKTGLFIATKYWINCISPYFSVQLSKIKQSKQKKISYFSIVKSRVLTRFVQKHMQAFSDCL